ncbi:MAG: acyltransferase domain-containing protein, partial [Trebonia sp.]
GMAAVSQPAAAVEDRLAGWPGLRVAAVNGPSSTVVSGDAAAVGEFVAACAADSIRARRIPVDYASHSAHVEAIRQPLIQALTGITPRSAQTPFCSTVSGEEMDTAELDADYWYRNLRQPVSFEAATRALLDRGHTTFIEVSPHPVLTPALQETFDAAGIPRARAIETLRRDHGDSRQFLASLARAAAHGVRVDWPAALAGHETRLVDLPTYAFQDQRYWLDAPPAQVDPADLGQAAPEHPLLGAVVGVAEDGSLLFTGRLSVAAHPWLADHAVLGTVLLPGAALVELALWCGERAGCGAVDELTLQAPVLLPGDGADLQVRVASADTSGRRTVTIHSRPASGGDPLDTASPDAGQWARHAIGTLAPAERGELKDETEWPSSWPPAGAVAIDVPALHADLAERGYDYGPAFRGLTAAWRDGDVVFADLRLPEERQPEVAGFSVHPALVDAALHALAGDAGGSAGTVDVPFAWSGVTAHARGSMILRARLAPTGDDRLMLTLANEKGAPVLSAQSVAIRPMPVERLAPVRADTELLRVRWDEVPAASSPAAAWAVLGPDALGLAGSLSGPGVSAARYDSLDELRTAITGPHGTPGLVLAPCAGIGQPGEMPADARAAANRVLDLLKDWLGDPRLEDSRLVFVTRGAIAAQPADHVTDLAHATAWGLIRAAQAENPDRFGIADVDDREDSRAALIRAPFHDEPQFAIRGGTVYAPRLSRPGSDGTLAPP